MCYECCEALKEADNDADNEADNDINFNDLPTDIKRLIFNINRDDAVKKTKIKFNKVINELNNIKNDFKTELDKNNDYLSVNDLYEIKHNEADKDDFTGLAGNGCLLCDMFLCDDKYRDYYAYDLTYKKVYDYKIKDADYEWDVDNLRFYKYYSIFNHMLFMTMIKDDDMRF